MLKTLDEEQIASDAGACLRHGQHIFAVHNWRNGFILNVGWAGEAEIRQVVFYLWIDIVLREFHAARFRKMRLVLVLLRVFLGYRKADLSAQK